MTQHENSGWGGSWAGLEQFIEWCTKERAKLSRRLDDYESGAMKLRRRDAGAGWSDSTEEEIRRLKKSIADLDGVLNRQIN
jgi:hypothetical protein